jgi:protein-S-isoprenylcysteine O-methyltransferase Ste14
VASILVAHLGIDPSQMIPESVYEARAVQLLRTLQPVPITLAFLAGSLMAIIGGVVRLSCSLALGKHWNSLLSVRKEHKLVTSGPYSVVRHPSYTAFSLQYVGVIVMHASQGSWMRESGVLQAHFAKLLATIYFFLFTTFAVIIIQRPPVEDEMLHHAFGEEWESWANGVKYRLLPGVY